MCVAPSFTRKLIQDFLSLPRLMPGVKYLSLAPDKNRAERRKLFRAAFQKVRSHDPRRGKFIRLTPAGGYSDIHVEA